MVWNPRRCACWDQAVRRISGRGLVQPELSLHNGYVLAGVLRVNRGPDCISPEVNPSRRPISEAEPYEGRGFANHPDPPLKAARTFVLADARRGLCPWRRVDRLRSLRLLEDLPAFLRRDQLDRPQVA